MNNEELIRHRLHASALVGSRLIELEDVVSSFVAVQAQDYPAAKWAVAQRTRDLTESDIDSAFDNGRILRTHVMRPTWHFVHPRDLRWLLELTAPRVHQFNGTYYRRCGLTETVLKDTNSQLRRLLRNEKHLTRKEIATALQAKSDDVNLEMTCVLMHAELDGVICSGPRKGKQQTYALLDERVPETSPIDRDEALVMLMTRYLTSHGPASLKDFVWWSGLTMKDAKAAVAAAGNLTEIETPFGPMWMNTDAPSPPPVKSTVQLLPNYDEYFIALKNRDAYDNSSNYTTSPHEGMFGRHVLFVGGKVSGAWKMEKDEIVVESLVELTKTQVKDLNKAVDRFSAFACHTYKLSAQSIQ